MLSSLASKEKNFNSNPFLSLFALDMEKICILGDSNIYRNMNVEKIRRRLNSSCSILEAARLHTFELHLSQLQKSPCEILLVSALSNIVQDAGTGMDPIGEEFSKKLVDSVKNYVISITHHLPSAVRVLFVPPLYRSSPIWFQDYFSLINSTLETEARSKSTYTLLPSFRVDSSDLLPDGVHLTVNAGVRFYEYVVSCILDVLPATVSLTQTGTSAVSAGDPDEHATSGDVMRFLKQSVVPRFAEISGLSDRVTILEETLHTQVRDVDVVLARHSDQLDNSSNREFSNRVIVTGFPADDCPTGAKEQKDFLVSTFREFIEGILGEVVFDVYTKGGKTGRNKIPPFTLRFTSAKDCEMFRRESFKKAKSCTSGIKDVTFFPKLVLGTRIRIEILRAIAKKLNDPNLSGYCPIYDTRAILHLGPVVEGRVVREETLGFVDAVLRFRHLISVLDMDFAYQKVGNAYLNALPQNFIVLNEADRKTYLTRPSKVPEPRGVKRKGDDRFTSSRGNRGGKRGR